MLKCWINFPKFLNFLAKIPEFWKNSDRAFRGFLWIPRILTELWSEKSEWLGPSPIEPFNPGDDDLLRKRLGDDEPEGVELDLRDEGVIRNHHCDGTVEGLGCKSGFGWAWTSNLFELTNLTWTLNLRTSPERNNLEISKKWQFKLLHFGEIPNFLSKLNHASSLANCIHAG